MKRHISILLSVSLSAIPAHADPSGFNYADALQKTVYFLEAQQSGELSPNNRVAWRADACLTDGEDIGKDLSGGWFDAGDHWTANLTMAFTAMTLAWSAIEQPDGWTGTGQIDELLESLVHVNQYFLKCVLNPEVEDPAENLRVVAGCGGREGVPAPAVHGMWGPAEVAHLMTNRPTFVLSKDCPGGDIPGAMASAMAATAMALREHGDALKGKNGFENFDAAEFATLLLNRAEKLALFGRAHMGPTITNELTEEEKEAISKARNLALRSDGEKVTIGYRAAPAPQVFPAMTWLARAAGDDQAARERWMKMAEEIYDGPYKDENYQTFWKDYGNGNQGKVGAYNMMRLEPGEEKY